MESEVAASVVFHGSHQVLGWSSCLRSPTNWHVVDLYLLRSCFTGLHVALYVTMSIASITPADAFSSKVSRHPMTSRVTLGYGQYHRRRLRNGLSVFDYLDLGDN